MAEPIFILDTDPSGTVATHAPRVVLPVLAAPVPEEQKAKNFNTIRQPLVVIGCMHLPDRGFAFDSSIVSPDAKPAFTKFARLMQKLKERDPQEKNRFPPCAVFGHADPTGKDEYNKTLSGRRALAVYGLLTRDVTIWDELFNNTTVGDHWGTKAIQTMLSTPLRPPPKDQTEDPFYTGPIDGGQTPQTKSQTNQAISAYKQVRGFGSGSTLSTAERHQLFRDYMNAICVDPAGDPFELKPTDFIAKGKGGKTLKADVQGCGEFNPIFILNKALVEDAKKDKIAAEVRNEQYRVDRRAIIYVFEHGTEVDHTAWPCPTAREGFEECKVRFWSDADTRRQEAEEDRSFGENMSYLTVDDNNNLVETPIKQTGNTMACRFYHSFAVHSPCEAKLKEWVIRFGVTAANGKIFKLRFRRFVAKLGESENSPVFRGTTDENGVVRLPVLSENVKMKILLDAARDIDPNDGPPDADEKVDESRFLAYILDGGALKPRDIDDDLAVKQRLYNLGFGEHAPETWTKEEFDRAFGAFRHRNQMDNASSDDVRRRIMDRHDLTGIPDDPDEGAQPESRPE